MEKKEKLRKRLYKMVDEFVEVCDLDSEYYLVEKNDYTTKIMEQEVRDMASNIELDKAKEEGYKKGVKDGMKGKVFNKVEIKEEAHIPKELIEKIREEGILEVLAMFDDYNLSLTFTAECLSLTFTAECVREQIIKLLEEENGKQNAR